MTTTYPPTTERGTEHPEPEDYTLQYWSYASALILMGFTAALTCFPRFLAILADSTNDTHTSLTPLESFLALHFGIWLAAISISLLLNIPSPSPVPPSASNTPSYHPLIATITFTSLLSSFLAYNTKEVQSLASVFCCGFLVIGLWGLWSLVFAGTASFSKKTGADKHTSSFMFKNQAAASQHKKRWKEANGRT